MDNDVLGFSLRHHYFYSTQLLQESSVSGRMLGYSGIKIIIGQQ